MMSRTHIFVGTMTAMAVMKPQSAQECVTALIGGLVGGIICDVDLKIGRASRIKQTAGISGVLLAAGLILNWVLQTGSFRCVCGDAHPTFAPGLFCFSLLVVWGMKQPHRGGMHSLLVVALLGGCVWMMCVAMAVPFGVAVLSHIALDMLNHKPLRLLYPLSAGWCLGVGRVDGRMNRWLCHMGILGTVFEIGVCIGRIRG